MGCLGQALSCRGEQTPARPTTGPTGPVLPWDLGPGPHPTSDHPCPRARPADPQTDMDRARGPGAQGAHPVLTP